MYQDGHCRPLCLAKLRAMIPFRPLFRNPHVQTIAGHLWPRRDEPGRFPISERLYRTEPDVQVLVQSQYPEGALRGQLIMVHGLEGSGEAGYVVSLSRAALRAGFAAHRFHMRTCGGTEHLCQTLYHAGLTSDLLYVLRDLAAEYGPACLVGFSLGGNLVLKLAGELEDEARPLLRGVCAVSAPLDLATCARRIAQPDNRLYERRFVRRMRRRLCATGRYRTRDFARLRSVMEIDDAITAPSFGFGTAAHYYATQSARVYLRGVRVPALLIHAQDDTLVPFAGIACEAANHPALELWAPPYGGHLGFIGCRPNRFWADAALMDWISRRAAS
jgi:uncharacterized protein